MTLMQRYQRSSVYYLLNFHDDRAKGRSCLLMHSCLASIITGLTGGLFYTSFLMSNGIDIVNIGIISFVPSIAQCFGMFSPFILERFAQRKKLLVGVRGFSQTLMILGVTLLPVFVKSQELKSVLFVALVFTATLVEFLVDSGYLVWHLQFMPDNVRADYLSLNTLVSNIVGLGVTLISGFVADALAGSAYESTVIILFRYLAFILLIADLFVLGWPKEFPYEKTRDKPRIRDIFVLPTRNRKFLLTIVILFLWGYFSSVPTSVLNYYLLDDVGVSYSYINIINMLYTLFLALFIKPWKWVMRRIGWWKTFAIAALLHVPTTLMYSCVTAANYLWLMTTLRILQHLFGVGMNITFSNLGYINMPNTDQTNYMAFRSFIGSAAGFLGMMTGTWFVAAFPNIVLTLFGMEFVNVQILQWVNAFGQLLVPVLIFLFLPKLQPDDPARIYA